MSKENTLAGTFSKIIRSADQEKNIVFVVDGSGSIGSADFSGPLKIALTQLTSKFATGKTRQGIIQFSGDGSESGSVRVECPLTNNTGQLATAIINMRQVGHRTNTLCGMQTAVSMVGTAGFRWIILITDGAPNHGQEPYDYIANLQGIEVICLGIGSIALDNVRRMSTGGQYYPIQNYNALLLQVENASMPIPDPPVRLSVNCDNDIAPGMKNMKELHLQLELRNTTDDALKPPMVVRFKRNCFFEARELKIEKEIPASGVELRNFELYPMSGAHTLDFPEILEYELVYNGYTWKGSCEFDTGFLRGDFLTGERYNILPFGQKGDGKSSSINSMLTCLMRGEVVAGFAVANLPDHVTNHFTFQEASEILRKKGETNVERLPFVFYDIWGTDDANFQQFLQFFPAIVRGKIPVKTRRDQLQDVDATQPNLDHAIHCLILVVQIAQYLQPAKMQELVDVTKQWISLDDRVGPVVLVTGIDKVEDPKTLETHKQKMMAALPVSANVFFIQNYTNHERKNVKIDMQMRRVLLAIRNNARENKAKIDHRVSPYPVPVPNNNNNIIINNNNNNNNNKHVPASVPAQSPIRPPVPAVDVNSLDALMQRLQLDACIPTGGTGMNLVDFEGQTVGDIEDALDFVHDAAHRRRLAEAIARPNGGASSPASGLGWENFVPAATVAKVLPTLTQSGMSPTDFSESPEEEIVNTLHADLNINKIHAKGVARMLVAHFKK